MCMLRGFYMCDVLRRGEMRGFPTWRGRLFRDGEMMEKLSGAGSYESDAWEADRMERMEIHGRCGTAIAYAKVMPIYNFKAG